MKYFIFSLVFCLVEHQYAAEKCQKERSPDDPKIYFLHVKSNINNRYATTTVVSKLVNPANHSQEVFFHMNLPESAYINSFIMEINGKEYEAYIKEKEEAKKIYTEAVSSGQSAGHVAVSSRDSNQFKISVNVEKEGKVKFTLKYEELLQRTLSMYRHVINLNPGQTVQDMKVEIHISEPSEIKNLFVPELKVTNEIDTDIKENKHVDISRPSDKKAIIKYAPSNDDQENIGGKCFQGQFIVEYDVDLVQPCGQVLVNNGYFVHFYAPKGLPLLNKLVVFVLDLSGSMYGRKLEQLKLAMSTILDELKESDFFTIVEFSFSVTVHNLDSATSSAVISPHTWQNEQLEEKLPSTLDVQQTFPATKHYIEKAKQVISKMSAGGGTNIYEALRTGIRVSHEALQKIKTDKNIKVMEPLIMFLTDGEPTVGTTDLNKINGMVNELNIPRSNLFSLGFGSSADINFLKKLSLRNAGFARTIYEASDAALQLKNFYKQISSPLLSNVTFTYTPDQVLNHTLTKKFFPNLFNGSELIVAGKVPENESTLLSQVQSMSQKGDFRCVSESLEIPNDEFTTNDDSKKDKIEEFGPLERLWAYLTTKQLLEEKEKVELEDDSKDKIEEIKRKALSLALKYKFVTPLTSLVVVKPNETDSVSDLKESSVTEAPMPSHYPVHALSAPMATYSFAYRSSIQRPYIRFGGGSADAFQQSANPVPMYTRVQLSPNLIAGGAGSPASAFGRPVYTLATEATNSLTTKLDEEAAEEEKSEEESSRLSDLEWLNEVLDNDNTTITIPIGNSNSSFSILANPGNDTFQQCTSTNNKVNGVCTHLANCIIPEIISSLQEYLDRFCPIVGRFAGICCPDGYVSPTIAPSSS